MSNKFLILAFSAAVTSAHAQMTFSLNLNPLQPAYNPIPYRDSIPSSLVKATQPHIFVIPAVAIKPAEPLKIERAALPGENKISLDANNVRIEKTPESVAKKVLVSPKMLTVPTIKVLALNPRKVIFDKQKETPVAEVKALDLPRIPTLRQDQVHLSELIEITNDEFKMIHALLLVEFQKKYDTAMSLFVELMKEGKFKTQATFHYAEMALNFGLFSEFKSKMFQVIKQGEDSSIKKHAVESLVKNAQAILPEDTLTIDTEASKYGVNTQSNDYYLVRRGKYQLNQGDLAQAINSLSAVNINSKLIIDARILLATAQYRGGDVNTAIKSLETAIPRLAADRGDKLRNLTYLTLARLYFQKGNYKQSYANYLLIDKGSSFWLQSTTEQALTQIMAGDYIGAAGNMFSLHTEYFKKAYAPESYIIRSIGYLNLCQYGDAVSVVSDLQRRYTKLGEQVTGFHNSNPKSPEYYGLVKELIAKPDQPEVNGLPRSFVLELARHPSFISIQKTINNYEDELTKFSGVANGLSAKSNTLRSAMQQARNDIKSLSTKKMTELQIAQIERKILGLDAELNIVAQGREKIERMKVQAAERIAVEKTKLKTLAAEALQTRFNQAQKELQDVLDQKDVLAYEIYSGAGEHLRYQMAGGETKDRAPAAALTPEEKQSYKWKFKGEVWEDEIGHYRSSLANVCPKDDYAKNSGGK